MKTCEEMTKSVLKRVHENNTAQKKRREVVLRTAIPVCGAFAIAGTVAFAKFTAKTPVSGSNSAIVAGGEDMTDSELAEEITSDSSNFATSTSTSPNESSNHSSIDYSKTPDELNSKLRALPFINNDEKLTAEEAKEYYNIDVFALEKLLHDYNRSYFDFCLRKNDDRLVYDGSSIEYENPEKTELLLVLFRKETKWQPAESYEPYDFAGVDVYFFKDSAESPETRAVFEVNGTQITLLYSGANEKMLLNAIKVFVNEKDANPNGNAAEEPVLCG